MMSAQRPGVQPQASLTSHDRCTRGEAWKRLQRGGSGIAYTSDEPLTMARRGRGAVGRDGWMVDGLDGDLPIIGTPRSASISHGTWPTCLPPICIS